MINLQSQRGFILSMTLIISACSYPVTNTKTVDDQPTLIFNYLPQDAVVHIDGIRMNTTPNLDKQGLQVSAGTHHVEITLLQKTILDQRIFVSNGLAKTIYQGVPK
jgi:hypothetical protein